MRSWPEEEYLEQPIVIMLEGDNLVLYYPYVMDGVETLIPLQEYVVENWTEDSEKRYQDGVSIIEEAVSTASLDVPESGSPESDVSDNDVPQAAVKEGVNHLM